MIKNRPLFELLLSKLTNRINNWLYKIGNTFERKVIVLMYHRIDNIALDPWSLAVSPENFEQQLIVLKKEFNVISVAQLLEQLENKKIVKDSICLTFDDAYVDNYLFARPLLEKYNCPATFFVPSFFIDKLTRFWWDELEDIIFNRIKLPDSLSITIDQELFVFQFKKDTVSYEDLQKQRVWVYNEEPPTEKCELYLELWKRLKKLDHYDLMSSLKQLKHWAGNNVVEESTDNMAMTLEQLRALIKDPLFKAGIHTNTHPALASHPLNVQKSEIVSCRNYLKRNLETYIDVIAYPQGNYNDNTISILKDIHIAAALTTDHKVVTKHSNKYKLGRFRVDNWNGEKFKKNISAWYALK